MTFEQHSRVRLRTDKHQSDGVLQGMLGYVLDVYPDGKYEVEFSDPKTGVTIAQVVVAESELAAAPEGPNARYYAVNDRPVAIVPTDDGGSDCLVFDFASGEMMPDRSYFEQVIPGSGKDVDSLTEAEFDARVVAYRGDASKRLYQQVRSWAEALCATTGDVATTASVLAMTGPIVRDDMTVEPPPRGFTKAKIKKTGEKGLALELMPAGSLFTRGASDAAFGAGTELPRIGTGRVQSIAYRLSVDGAPRYCTISFDFMRNNVADRILMRRDWL